MMPARSQSKNNEKIGKIKEAISRSQSILVTSHIRPDGDAVGSVLGLGLALLDSGKNIDMVLEDGVPASFKYLYGSSLVLDHPKENYDLIIVLDCSDIARISNSKTQKILADINIDHHVTNNNFARINYVDDQAASSAEILAHLIPKLSLEINQPIATALLNGIVTDTIGFRTTNVKPVTLNITADLIRHGAHLSDVYYRGIGERTFTGARYWGIGLSKLKKKHGIVWTSLTLEERRKVGYRGGDDADLINILSSIKDAKIAIIFIEQHKGRVKISWRICGPEKIDLDVSQVACEFGGGGHKSAAGAMVEGSLDDIQQIVLDRTKLILI